MAERKWTDEQRLAINTTDKTLLVSAAAGSGKTATLTQRIITSILNEEHPMSLSGMLIVTFTNAAVEELRQRIYDAVKGALEADPANERLEAQLLSVKDARIMTIDAFCNTVVRSCTQDIGILPNYRISDAAEEQLLMSSIMDELILAAYEGELSDVCDAGDFVEVSECLISARGERGLKDVFRLIYEKTETSVNGIDSLDPYVEEFNPEGFTSVENTRYGEYVIGRLKRALTEYRREMADYTQLEHGSSTEKKARAGVQPRSWAASERDLSNGLNLGITERRT